MILIRKHLSRVSLEKYDPGYRIDGFRFQPYLNGRKVNGAVTADENGGFVRVYGKYDHNDEFDTHFGTVEIRRVDPFQPYYDDKIIKTSGN